jgi:hypothetical protein
MKLQDPSELTAGGVSRRRLESQNMAGEGCPNMSPGEREAFEKAQVAEAAKVQKTSAKKVE